MRCLYRERRWLCGDYMEVDIYPVYRQAQSRGKRAKPSTETQKRLNERNARRKLVRLLNANFDEKDIEIHLTYKNDALPADAETAAKQIRNYLRRVKTACRRAGLSDDIKYIYVTEGGGKRRFHHHLTISCGLERDALEKLWQNGYANARRLQFSPEGIEGLAYYITKQVGTDENAMRRSWNASKNLIRPIPIDRDGKISARKVQEIAAKGSESSADLTELYPGWAFASKEAVTNTVNGETYIFARMYRERRIENERKVRFVREGAPARSGDRDLRRMRKKTPSRCDG